MTEFTCPNNGFTVVCADGIFIKPYITSNDILFCGTITPDFTVICAINARSSLKQTDLQIETNGI
jgi:hypothetical protein